MTGRENMNHAARERLEQAERDDWENNKRLFKEALSEWVESNPKQGHKLISDAIAAYIEGLIKTQMESIGHWTVRGLWALAIGGVLYAWWKTMGWKI